MIAFVSILVCGIEISAKEKRVGAFQFSYVTLDGDNVQITKIIPTQETIPNKLIIPDKIDGKSVVKLGDLYDDDDGGRGINLFGIYLSEESKKMKLLPTERYKQMGKIKRIVLPSALIEITPNCFEHMQDGKEINIPSAFEKNVISLCQIEWKKVVAHSTNKKFKVKNHLLLSKSGKKVYGCIEKSKKIKVPNGVETIINDAFSGRRIKKIVLPKTMKKIGSEAFSGSRITKFCINPKNKYYASNNGCLYNRKSRELVAVRVKGGVARISSRVKVIPKGVSFYPGYVKKIVFPNEIKKLSAYWRHSIPYLNKIAEKTMLRTVIRITDGFSSFFGRRSVTSVRLTSPPFSRQASAAARSVISTNTATTSSSVKDHERWMTLRENTFPTVSTRISSVEMTSTIFSTAASAFMSFLYTFILFPLLYIFPVSDPYRVV